MAESLPLLSIHQYNPASKDAHRTFLRWLDRLNQVIASSGLAKTEYLAWRVIGERQGPFGYVFGSLWPDRETYERVHRLRDFEGVVKECQGSGQLFEAEVHNRFVLLDPPEGEPPVVLAKLFSRLVMDAGDLESVRAERQFLDNLKEGTAAIAKAGHPETRYDLWRIAGTAKGPFTHLFGSLWSSAEAYESVHAHPAHQAFLERHGRTLDKLMQKSLANRYDRLDLT